MPEQDLAGDPVRRGAALRPIDNVPNWKDLSPRIGATYDLFGNGKTVLRGNWGKYLASESTNMATLNNRVNTSVNSASARLDGHQRQLRPGLQPDQLRADLQSAATSAGCSTRRSGR